VIVHRRGFVLAPAPRDPSFARWGDFGRPRRPSRWSCPRHIIRHYLQLLERPNVAVVTGGYPTHVPDPLSRRGHAIWRFMPRRTAGRYAAYDLSDEIGADSRHSAFHWLRYLLRQPRFSKKFSWGASRGPLWAFRRDQLQDSEIFAHRVSNCHQDQRCGALVMGFPAHQPVVVGHAMALSLGPLVLRSLTCGYCGPFSEALRCPGEDCPESRHWQDWGSLDPIII